MRTRTVGSIALRPNENDQGGHFYLLFLTGRHLNRPHVTPLFMLEDVISRVHKMAHRNPKVTSFLDRNNNPTPDISNDDDDSSYAPDDDDSCIASAEFSTSSNDEPVDTSLSSNNNLT